MSHPQARLRQSPSDQGPPPIFKNDRDILNGTLEVLLVLAVEARADAYVYLLSAERLQRLPQPQQPNLDRLRQERIAQRARRRGR